MGNHLGYAVIEYNQASHQPDVLDHSFTDDLDWAQDIARQERARVAACGRLERYTIAEVIELSDDND